MPIDISRPYGQLLATMSRRQLLDIAWKLGAVVALPMTTRLAWAQPVFKQYPFALGVASGDPWPESVVLWTRLAPEPLEGGGMPMANVEVSWQVATDRTFRNIIRSGTAIARPELGHSVHVEAEGLAPGREFFYRFRCGGETSQIGRTVTAPAPGASVDRLRFGVCGCAHFETGYFTGYGRLAEERFDFVFHTGDYIYEGRGDAHRNPNSVRQHLGQEPYTLVDYRNRYAQYKSDPDLMAAHLSAPFIMTWDDHQVDNGHAGDRDERDTPPEIFLLRRAAAYQAYYESMPLRASTLASGAMLPLYRRLQFGNLINFNVLDTRQYRSRQAAYGDSDTCPDLLDVRQTILDEIQEAWLFENLSRPAAQWTVLGQQVPTFARDMASANSASRHPVDKWDGYLDSRRRLFSHFQDAKVPNPIVLSGDVHAHWCADLKADFRDPSSAAIGVEFTNSSITSGGDGSEVQPAWESIRRDNPHITYHGNRRGYVSCTATPKTLRADFRVIDKVTARGAAVRTAATRVVEAGRPGSLPS